MATWPSSTKADTANLDAGTDSPRLARVDILQNVNNVNSIIDMFNIPGSPTDNYILKYNSSTSKFDVEAEAASQSLFSTLAVSGQDNVVADAATDTLTLAGATGITITTNASTDTITFTGPTLTSYLTASSSATLTNKAGNISQWTNDSGYITSDLSFIGSTITAPSNADFTLTTSGTGTIDLDATVRFNKNYKEDINTLTSSSTITVDCTAASVHEVTLASSTQFVVSSLPVGGTVTLIITSDSTGSYTASFGTDDSTTVKFAGGSPTISTTGGSTDIVSIFHANGQYYGNIAKDFKTS